MIDIKECSVGDVCWALVPNVQTAPMYGTIEKIVESEGAIQILTLNYGIRIAHISKVFWSEKEAKAAKKKK
jgi:hypothetical protein